jgi:hypothetical protein
MSEQEQIQATQAWEALGILPVAGSTMGFHWRQLLLYLDTG